MPVQLRIWVWLSLLQCVFFVEQEWLFIPGLCAVSHKEQAASFHGLLNMSCSLSRAWEYGVFHPFLLLHMFFLCQYKSFMSLTVSCGAPPRHLLPIDMVAMAVLLGEYISILKTSPGKNLFDKRYQDSFDIYWSLLLLSCSNKRVFICLTEFGKKWR